MSSSPAPSDRDEGVAASAQRTFTVPVMVCGNGHTYETVFPASFKGTPCRECGSPLRRAES